MDVELEVYRQLFEANPRPILVWDRETMQIRIVNQAACDHYGWSRDELVRMTLRDIRPPDEIPGFERAYADPTKDRSRSYARCTRHRTKDGRVLEVTLEIAMLTLDGRRASIGIVTDVTGIADSERRFRLLVEHSADGIGLTSAGGKLLYVSPGGLRCLGYASDDIDLADATREIHPEDLAISTAPAPGTTTSAVTRVRHRDGDWRWIESTTTNLTHDPAVRAFVTNFRDITERKRAERALIDSQHRLEFLLTASSAITYTSRASGDFAITFVSGNVLELLGHPAAAFTTDPAFWRDHLHVDDRVAVDAERARLAEGDTATLQYRFLHAGGTYRWIRDVARVIRDPGGAAIELVGYWIDVTEQVRAETMVRRSESNFRTLIERTPLATFVHRDGVFRYLNPAAVALLGCHRLEELVGQPVSRYVHPEDRESVGRRMQQLATTGSVPVGSARMLRADGSVFVFEVDAVMLDFDGEQCNVVMGHDVSERHEMFARMALADRMLSVGTLAAGVAHEINNPLSYVATNLEVLASDLPNLRPGPHARLSDGTLRSLVTDAREGVGRVSAIVRDLRALSRGDDESRGSVDVVAVLASSIKMAHNEIRHRAKIVEAHDGALPPVLANASRLGQVFLNLLINAAQAIADGHADRNEIRIRTGVTPGGDRVQIGISDTGSGIPRSILGRIFDPFFTTKAPGVGVGLGLAISHQIVRSLGGAIDVASTPGQGSTFTVTLPVATSRDDAERSEPARLERAASRRVLLIDDEAALGRSLAALLAPEIDVIAVTRATDALDRLRAGDAFDAIVCDLMMPEVSGIELYGELAALDPGYVGRLIFITGGAFTPHAREFLSKVACPHLEKPFSEQELRRALDRVSRDAAS